MGESRRVEDYGRKLCWEEKIVRGAYFVSALTGGSAHTWSKWRPKAKPTPTPKPKQQAQPKTNTPQRLPNKRPEMPPRRVDIPEPEGKTTESRPRVEPQSQPKSKPRSPSRPVETGSLTDIQARDWYHAQEAIDKEIIGLMLADGYPYEMIAREAHRLQNARRTQARDLMADQEKARSLPPNMTWEETMAKYNGDYKKIIEKSFTTNKDVNASIEARRQAGEQ